MLPVNATNPLRNKPSQAVSTAIPVAEPSRPLNAVTSESAGIPVRPSVQNILALTAPRLQFGHKLLHDRPVFRHGYTTPIDGRTVALSLLRMNVLDQIMRNQGDPRNLLYSLNPRFSSSRIAHEAALGDNLVLLDRGVDVVIEGHAGPSTVLALMMSRLVNDLAGTPSEKRSKCYMGQNATLYPGELGFKTEGETHDQLIFREYAIEGVRDKESLMMRVTGETDRKSVYTDALNTTHRYNSLDALWFGKHGLVDAILVGHDKVLTREGLESYYTDKGWLKEVGGQKVPVNKLAIQEFNEAADNLNKREIKKYLVPLTKYSPASTRPIRVENPPHRSASGEGKRASLQIATGGLFEEHLDYNDELPVEVDIANESDKPSRIGIKGYKPSTSIIFDDVILFNDEFNDSIATQFVKALDNLRKKKVKQADPSHIKILLDSPGGSVDACKMMCDKITGLPPNIKADVIVQGEATSCGAWLLASTTGNRFATPSSRIMVHQVRSGARSAPVAQFNGYVDNCQRDTNDYINVITRRSGRPKNSVELDFRQDTYLNVLEAMFYGQKGMIDGILVGPDRVITRDDVEEYLRTDLGVQTYLNERFPPQRYKSQDKVGLYIRKHLEGLREPNQIHEPDKWENAKGSDPFNNPLKVIMALAPKAKTLAELAEQEKRFKGSVTRPQAEIEQYVLSSAKKGE